MHPYLDKAMLTLALTAMCGLVFVTLAKDPVTGKVGVALFTAASVGVIFVGFGRIVMWMMGT